MESVRVKCKLCEFEGPHQKLVVREMMFGTREPYEYFCCSCCDSLQLIAELTAEELSAMYGQNYYSHHLASMPRVTKWLCSVRDRHELGTGGGVMGAIMARLLSEPVVEMLGHFSLARHSRILDVGCGDGALLDRLANAGFTRLLGIDPFIAEDAKTRSGVAVLKRELEQVAGEFDMVMFNHSLEHVADPVLTLKAARERLPSGGMCLVRLPTTSSEAWRYYKANWVQIDAPRHFVIPSRDGIALAAEKTGFRLERTVDDSSSFQFSGSEKFARDVALTARDKLFNRRQMREWGRRAALLNKRSQGDQAGFLLRAA